MKKILLITCLLLATIVTACGSNDEAQMAEVPISASMETITAPADDESYTIDINCEHDWFAYSYDKWIKAGKSDGKLLVTVAANTSSDSREGTVYIKSGVTLKKIPVTQAGISDAGIVAPEGYKLVWNDDFSSSSLGADWTPEVKPAGWVNNELQNYVNGSADGKPVTEIKDGTLRINCFKGSDGKIYSGRLYAKRNEGWTYGYFEACLKLPKGKGCWPAFWMMPVTEVPSWPGSGEIDIMEEVGYDPDMVHHTIHCNKYNNTNTTIEHFQKKVKGAEGEFHVYACEWTENALSFYIDGEKTFTYTNDGSGNDAWPFNKPFYVILNLAWGGVWGGQKGVDETALPATMEVKYVRVFQKK